MVLWWQWEVCMAIAAAGPADLVPPADRAVCGALEQFVGLWGSPSHCRERHWGWESCRCWWVCRKAMNVREQSTG